MQLTATEVKMDDTINGNGQVSPDYDNLSLSEADSIGRSFVRQFYTSITNSSEKVATFYGHKSIFQFNDFNAVGQKEIGNFFATGFPEKKSLKIYTIKGVPSFNSGIVLQVFGELNGRRFHQTFILGQQTAKKYYVEIDLFQYIDLAFLDPKATEKKVETRLNGKVSNDVRLQPEEPKPVVKSPIKPSQKETNGTAAPAPPAPKAQEKQPEQKPQQKHEPKVQHQQSKAPAPKAVVEPQAPVAAPAPAPAPVVESPPKPRTWANLVGGSARQQPPQPQHFAQPPLPASTRAPQKPVAPVQNTPVPASAAVQPQQQQAVPAPQQNGGASHERKIFLGNIIRNIVPDSTISAENEIKSIFNKLGGQVENVFIPGKVLDNPNDTSKYAFAFITFNTPEAAQKIFEHASKDEKNDWRIQLKVEAFGFDGLATISEQRERFGGGYRGGPRGGFRHSRGGFAPRGRGGPPRGGQRNGFPQQ